MKPQLIESISKAKSKQLTNTLYGFKTEELKLLEKEESLSNKDVMLH